MSLRVQAVAGTAAGAGDLTEWDWQIWGNIAASLNGSPAYQKLLAASHLEIRARTFLEMSFMARLN